MPIKRHGVVLLGPSAGGEPPFIGAKCSRGPTFYWGQVQEGTHLLLGPRAGGDPPFIGAKGRRGPTFYWGQVQEGTHLLLGPSAGGDPPFIGAKCRRGPAFYWGQVQEGTHLLLGSGSLSDKTLNVVWLPKKCISVYFKQSWLKFFFLKKINFTEKNIMFVLVKQFSNRQPRQIRTLNLSMSSRCVKDDL